MINFYFSDIGYGPGMPRKARIDATGALHHIIDRGIERMRIFKDSANSVNFLARRGKELGGHT